MLRRLGGVTPEQVSEAPVSEPERDAVRGAAWAKRRRGLDGWVPARPPVNAGILESIVRELLHEREQGER